MAGRIETIAPKKHKIIFELGRGVDGKRKRKTQLFYGSKQDAKIKLVAIQSKMEDQGSSALIARGEKATLDYCKVLLKDFPHTTIVDAVRYYVKMHPNVDGGVTLKRLIEKFKEKKGKKGLSEHTTMGWYETQCEGVLLDFGDIPYEEMDGELMLMKISTLKNKRDYRKRISPVTMHNKAKVLKMIFESGVRSKMMAENPITLELIDEILPAKDSKNPQTIFTPQEIKDFLYNAERPAMFLPTIFAGLRVQTLLNLDWDRDFDREHKVIHIPKEFDKKNKERYLEQIPGTFWEWVEFLDPHGAVCDGFSEKGYYTQRNKAMEKAGLSHHSANVFRRSFASNGIHVLGLNLTLMLMLHKGDPTTFHEHYYVPTLKSRSVDYFEIPVPPC